MLGKKVFAAMLATVLGASLFGANAAKAVINLDATDRSSAVATYATETLVEGDDGYSVVMAPDTGSDTETNLLNVTGKIGLGGHDNSSVTVRFELSGMVFSAEVMGGAGGDFEIVGHGSISIRSGGKVGDDYVSFIASRQSGSTRDSLATLEIDQLGVKPGVGGSVTMMVSDTLGPETHTASYPNAVRTMRGLDEIRHAYELRGHR